MPVRDYLCCLFLSPSEEQKTKTAVLDAKAVLAQAKEKLLADKKRIDPATLADITPESSCNITPRSSVSSPPLVPVETNPKPSFCCRCW